MARSQRLSDRHDSAFACRAPRPRAVRDAAPPARAPSEMPRPPPARRQRCRPPPPARREETNAFNDNDPLARGAGPLSHSLERGAGPLSHSLERGAGRAWERRAARRRRRAGGGAARRARRRARAPTRARCPRGRAGPSRPSPAPRRPRRGAAAARPRRGSARAPSRRGQRTRGRRSPPPHHAPGPRWLRARAAQAACELGRVEQRNGEGEDVPPAACKVPRLRAAQ